MRSKRVIYAALAGNAAIAAIKFGAAALTLSSAMLSEAVHSVVDTGNQLLLLLGLAQASRAPTQEHPFGFGLRLYFWAFVVAILIFGLGAGISAYEGLLKIANPEPIENVAVSYAVLLSALVIEGSVWTLAFREFRRNRGTLGWIQALRRSKDPMVFTVLFEDSAAVLGLLAALIGTALSRALALPVLDGVASLVIALILATTAALLAYECLGLLTGEGVAPAVRHDIRRTAGNDRRVTRVGELLTMHFGPADVLVAISLDFHDDLTAADVEGAVTDIERAVKAAHPEVKRIFIEAQNAALHQDIPSLPER